MTAQHHPLAKSPVSFSVHVARLPQKGLPILIDADARQRAALAVVHGVFSVERFRAELLVVSWKRNGVRVEGKVEAEIIQECVVTLDPVHNHIDERVAATFLPEDSKLGRLGFEGGGEIMIDPEGEDSPETFSGDTIDVGALAEQIFGLAIDPYPRSQQAAVPELQSGPADEAEWQAKLRQLAGKS